MSKGEKTHLMLLRDVEGWPPVLKETYASSMRLEPNVPATLKRCMLFTTVGSSSPYLSVVVTYQARDWHAMIVDMPEDLLRRIEKALTGREGQTLADLGRLEI